MKISSKDRLFGKLIEPYYQDIYYYICVRMKGKDEAEDVLQEAMMAAWYNIEKLRDHRCAKTWLYKIAENKVNAYYQKQNYMKNSLYATDYVDMAEMEHIADSEQEVIDYILSNEAKEFMERALNKLSEKCRKVIILRIFNGFKFREISEILNINESTVKQQFFRGVRKLRVIYEKMAEKENYK